MLIETLRSSAAVLVSSAYNLPVFRVGIVSPSLCQKYYHSTEIRTFKVRFWAVEGRLKSLNIFGLRMKEFSCEEFRVRTHSNLYIERLGQKLRRFTSDSGS